MGWVIGYFCCVAFNKPIDFVLTEGCLAWIDRPEVESQEEKQSQGPQKGSCAQKKKCKTATAAGHIGVFLFLFLFFLAHVSGRDVRPKRWLSGRGGWGVVLTAEIVGEPLVASLLYWTLHVSPHRLQAAEKSTCWSPSEFHLHVGSKLAGVANPEAPQLWDICRV